MDNNSPTDKLVVSVAMPQGIWPLRRVYFSFPHLCELAMQHLSGQLASTTSEFESIDLEPAGREKPGDVSPAILWLGTLILLDQVI